MKNMRNITVVTVMRTTSEKKSTKANVSTTKDTIEAEMKMEKKDTMIEMEMNDIIETEMKKVDTMGTETERKDIMETKTEKISTMVTEMMNITEEDVI